MSYDLFLVLTRRAVRDFRPGIQPCLPGWTAATCPSDCLRTALPRPTIQQLHTAIPRRRIHIPVRQDSIRTRGPCREAHQQKPSAPLRGCSCGHGADGAQTLQTRRPRSALRPTAAKKLNSLSSIHRIVVRFLPFFLFSSLDLTWGPSSLDTALLFIAPITTDATLWSESVQCNWPP
jgi:hypothetical protein